MTISNTLNLKTLITCAALVFSGNALAVETNPFNMPGSVHVLQLAESGSKCGGKQKPADSKCGGKEKPADSKCGSGKPEPKKGKCGAAKCGGK